jgi:osmotically-inducible protein OsmY
LRQCYREGPPAPEDSEIRSEILGKIKGLPWGGSQVNLTVRDGVAELWGTVLDERERHALRVAVENVRGVAGIKDHIVFVEAYTRPFV